MSEDSEVNGVEDALCKEFANASLETGADSSQETVTKGRHRIQQHGTTCQELTKKLLKEVLIQRRPTDFSIDSKTLDTPIHRFLEAPEHRDRRGCQLVEPLNQLLAELSTMGYLTVYVNMPNKFGRTPLSLCLKAANLAELIEPLVRHGAQLHHLCGNLSERCNHLHYVMLKGTPSVINAALDEVSRSHPFGADGMYAMNRSLETPKASLQRRIRDSGDCPGLQRELSLILNRILGYPPVDGVPQLTGFESRDLSPHQALRSSDMF